MLLLVRGTMFTLCIFWVRSFTLLFPDFSRFQPCLLICPAISKITTANSNHVLVCTRLIIFVKCNHQRSKWCRVCHLWFSVFSLQHLCLLDTGSNPYHQVERILCKAFEDDIVWCTILPMALPFPNDCLKGCIPLRWSASTAFCPHSIWKWRTLTLDWLQGIRDAIMLYALFSSAVLHVLSQLDISP